MQNEKNTVSTLRVGSVVRSKCGRDRKRVFLVIGIDESDMLSPVIIADGELHKLGDAKRKNPKHLEAVKTDFCCGENDVKTLLNKGENGKIAEICKKAENR